MSDGRVRVRAVINATARDAATSSAEINCHTTGVLEKKIAAEIAERLGT